MTIIPSLSSIVVLIQIVAVDLILGGDNAVVIALVCRRLPENLVGRAALLGTIGAIASRALMATIATTLIQTPYLKIVGGALLIAIATRLLSPQSSRHRRQTAQALLSGDSELWRAIGLMLVADVAMSMDNIVAVAAIANGDVATLVLGVALSIPLIVYGGFALSALGRSSPALTEGAAVLVAWIGGSLIVTDPAIADWVERQAPALALMAPLAAAIFVLAEGRTRALASSEKVVSERSSRVAHQPPVPAPRRAADGVLGERPRPSSRLLANLALATAAAGVDQRSVSVEAELGETRSGEDRLVLLGFLALFLIAGLIVLWAIVSGDGVLDARG
ncbi:MAG TPA: YjbE family putative metal transport protein [Roseiarcus sp.]|nr:YjbE family putative metal transport protein [Roseiarcus sp.]